MKQQAPFEVAAHGFYCADAEVQFSAPALSLRLSKFFLSRFESSEMRCIRLFHSFPWLGTKKCSSSRTITSSTTSLSKRKRSWSKFTFPPLEHEAHLFGISRTASDRIWTSSLSAHSNTPALDNSLSCRDLMMLFLFKVAGTAIQRTLLLSRDLLRLLPARTSLFP